MKEDIRRFVVVPMITMIIALISGYYGFYLSNHSKLQDEKFEQLVEDANSPHIKLKLQAIKDLGEYGERSYLHLRRILITTSDKLVKQAVLDVLPKDFGFDDTIQSAQFKEEVSAENENRNKLEFQQQANWIWLGNFDYRFNRWIENFSDLSFPSTVEFDSLKRYQPHELKGHTFKVTRSTHIRSGYPEGRPSEFASKVGLLNKEDLIKVTDFKEIAHPNPNTKRIWAKIEQQR